jgi:uncharacterized protein involved in outer membrane biogenesis
LQPTRHRILFALLLVAALVGVAELAVRLVRVERLRGPIEQLLRERLDLEVTLAGDLQLSLLPGLHLEAGDVRVSNLPGRPSPLLFRAGAIELRLDPWLLLASRLIEIRGLRATDVELHIEPDAEGRFELPPGLEAPEDEPAPGEEMTLTVGDLSFEDIRVHYRAGAGERVYTTHFEKLALEADEVGEPLDVKMRGDVDGSRFDVTGSVGPVAELFTPTRPYPVALRGRVFEAPIELEGSIAVPTELRGLDLRVSARIPDFGRELRARGGALPELGAVSVSGHIADPDGVFGVSDLAITTDRGAREVEVRGEIRDLASFGGVDLDVQLRDSNLDLLAPFVDRPLPEIDALELTARLSDADGSLGARGEARASTRGDRVEVGVSGEHGDLSRIDELDVQIAARVSDLSLLGETLELAQTLPELGPLEASGRLRERGGTLSIEDLVVSLGTPGKSWAEAEGHVHDLAGLRKLSLRGRFGGLTAEMFEGFLGRRLPNLGQLEGSVEVSDDDGSVGIERFRVDGGRDGAFRFAAKGSLDKLDALDEISLQLELEARDLAVLGALAGRELPAVGPVAFSGRVSGSDGRLETSGESRLGRTRFTEELSLSFAEGTRPRLVGTLSSKHLRLEDLGMLGAAAGSAPGESRGEAPVRGPLGLSTSASSEPLPFARLRDLDAQLELRVERMTATNGIDVHDLHTEIRLETGDLTVSDFSGSYEGGSLAGGLRIDARRDPPQAGVFLDASGVDLQRLADLMEGNRWEAGIGSVWLDVESSGHSPRQLRENLSGTANTIVRDGTLGSRYAEMFVTNLVRVVFPTRTGEIGPIACFRAELDLERGVATARSLLLKGAAEGVTGEGRIDLRRGRYELELTPHTTKPGLISVAARVRVTGPLDDPQFTPVKHTIATSVARGLVANALRPADEVRRRLVAAPASAGNPCDAPLVDPAAARVPSWLERR